ncbi:ubiquinone anaerobic biosynthesis accessory factor UbiT [Microbaculum marinisediminis]|uniref:SCP2 sterol-binding domain-containing protein n=1 Tax=Microbaculum marinisediminis TaxID=2931392 RepID=A0AAW5QVS3_9HYPH|nr:SCP2 sterol-binding domain-containing protein [Microbaculum sp. A6E488]MCT8972161.1 SCP2 sterol-binding domain-containing protein [Microbaculum sp. A6E488]
MASLPSMSVPARAQSSSPPLPAFVRDIPAVLLAAVPLAVLQPLFNRIAAHVARTRPELFARLGPHTGKYYLIDPRDLPFVLVLRPDATSPYLKAHRRHEHPHHDAVIAGTFLDLLEMIDGSLDGDALFFSRDLRIGGDTEAVVALRNALDDFEGSALDSVLSSFGLLSRPAATAVAALRALAARNRQGSRHE